MNRSIVLLILTVISLSAQSRQDQTMTYYGPMPAPSEIKQNEYYQLAEAYKDTLRPHKPQRFTLLNTIGKKSFTDWHNSHIGDAIRPCIYKDLLQQYQLDF